MSGPSFSTWADDIDGFICTLDHGSDTGIEKVNIEDWSAIAQDREVRSHLEDDYVNYCYGRWH